MSEGSPKPTKKRSRPSGPFHKMTSAEFRQWVADMGYPARDMNFPYEMPYDPAVIAEDLGVHENRIYAYWRGQEKGNPIQVSAMVTKLCVALLEIKRHRRRGK